MPRGNGTGPMGQGPRTGRGAGFCAGYDTPRYGGRFGAGFGHGYGRGQGRGFGFQQRMRAAMSNELTTENEKAFLQNRVEILTREIENANKRLAELNATKES